MSYSLDKFLFANKSTRYSVILRIGVGFILFFWYLQMSPYAEILFSKSGMALIESRLLLPSQIIYILFSSVLIFSIFLIAGLFTQFSIFMLWLLHTLFLLINPSISWGAGFILLHTLFFLFFCKSGRRFSLDVKWRKLNQVLIFKAWPYRFIQAQVVLIYLITCSNRVDSAVWQNGEALTYALLDGTFSRWCVVNWSHYNYILRPIGLLGYIVEWCGAFIYVFGRFKPYVALALVAFHLTLELTTVIQYWQFLMIFLLLSFIPEHWFSEIYSKIRRAYEISR